MEAFASKLRERRAGEKDSLNRRLSQNRAARLFNVSLSTYANWEAGRHLPDERSREKMATIWPEIFE